MLKKIVQRFETKNKKKPIRRKPFDQREKLYSLVAIITIVNRHQAQFFLKSYEHLGASLSLVLYAHSMPPEEIIQMLGQDVTKKDIIITIARKEYVKDMLEVAKERFKISKASKGVAFVVPVDSVSGVSVYKFLSDFEKEARINGE